MQRTKCLHVCLHIDWNPYGTFKQIVPGSLHLVDGIRCRGDERQDWDKQWIPQQI